MYNVNEELKELEMKSDEEQIKFTEKYSQLEDKVKKLQKKLTKDLFICYNNEADEVITNTATASKDEQEDDDFELIEADDLEHDEDFQDFKKKHGSDNLGSSTYAVLYSKITFKDDTFNLTTSK